MHLEVRSRLTSTRTFAEVRPQPVLRMDGANEPSRVPKTLFSFNSQEDIDQFATGCDADVGGMSTVNFALDESTAKPTNPEKPLSVHEVIVNRPTGKFWGEMKLAVRSGLEGQIRGGYAGFRSKVRNPCRIPGTVAEEMSFSLVPPSLER